MDYGHKMADDILSDLEKELNEIYSEANESARKKADKYLARFKEQDAIMQKKLQDKKITEQEYKQWRLGKMKGNARYTAMQDALARDMTNTNQIAASVINGHLPDVYASNYNWSTYQIEQDARIDTNFVIYDRQTVERLIRDKPDLLPMTAKVDIPEDMRWNKKKINNAITQGVLLGESIPDISKRLASVTDMNRNAAVRNARTMTTSAENGGRIDSYKRAQDMGIKLTQEWLATNDNRTRHEHRELNGQERKVGEPFKVDGYEIRFPADPTAPPYLVYNCRCTLISNFKGFDFKKMDKYAKETPMTYKEWEKKHINKSTGEFPDIKYISIKDITAETIVGEIDPQELTEWISRVTNGNIYIDDAMMIYNDLIDSSVEEYINEIGNLLTDEMEMMNFYSSYLAVIDKEFDFGYMETILADNIKPTTILAQLDYESFEKWFTDTIGYTPDGLYDFFMDTLDMSMEEFVEEFKSELESDEYGKLVSKLLGKEISISKGSEGTLTDKLIPDKKKPNTKEGWLYQTAYSFTEKTVAKCNEMNDLIENADKDVQKVWKKYAKALERPLALKSNERSAYYNPLEGRVHLDADKTGKRFYVTFFHEYGHNIDFIATGESGSKDNFTSYTDMKKNKGRTLGELIETEWKKKFCDSNGNVNEVKVKQYIKDMTSKYSVSDLNDLSDMLEKFTYENLGIDYPLGGGHGGDYYLGSGQIASHEAFAEMFSAEIANPVSLEIIKQELPRSYSMFRSILKEIVK